MRGKHLFSEFDGASKEAWKRRALQELAGRSYESILWNAGGMCIEPYYTPDEVITSENAIFTHRQPSWRIRQNFEVGDDYTTANKKIRKALDLGIQDVGIHFTKPFGSLEDLHSLFDGLQLIDMHLHFSGNSNHLPIIDNFLTWVQDKNYDPTALHGSFDGMLQTHLEDRQTVETIKKITKQLPSFRLCSIKLQAFDSQCADFAHVLSKALEHAEQLFRKLKILAINENQIPVLMQWEVSVGPFFFLEIAKLRAVRILWKRWLDYHGISYIPAYIQAFTDLRHERENAPHQNLLQHTTEAMSAIIGGCDVLCLISPDYTLQSDTDFLERIQINIHHILRHEVHMDAVADPGGGSYYIETMTKQLCDRAWNIFSQATIIK